MTDPNHDPRQPLPTQAEQDRLAKLRALGREMHSWHRFDKRYEALRSEAAAKEQDYLRERQLHLQELENARIQQEALTRELETARIQQEALTAELAETRRTAADHQRIAADYQCELQAQLDNSRLQLQQVLSSRSWKITQPLRDVTKWLGQGRDVEGAAPVPASEPGVAATPPSENPTLVEPPQNPVGDPGASSPVQTPDEALTPAPSVNPPLELEPSQSSAESFVTATPPSESPTSIEPAQNPVGDPGASGPAETPDEALTPAPSADDTLGARTFAIECRELRHRRQGRVG